MHLVPHGRTHAGAGPRQAGAPWFLEYYYYLATSKYFVNNVNFETAYVKRDGQIEIQTMHGTPLKTLGLDVVADFPARPAASSILKRTIVGIT